MGVVHPPEARGGKDIFVNGIGELYWKSGLGSQDEDVEIDDEDVDAPTHGDSGRRLDACQSPTLAGASGGATEGPEAGGLSEPATNGPDYPGRVAGVSRTPSRKQRGQHTAELEGLIGQSQSVRVARASNPTVGSHSKPVDNVDEDGVVSREKDVQNISKRKVLESEPSTSTLVKRAKLHSNSTVWKAVSPREEKAEDLELGDTSPRKRMADSPSKRKERLMDREREGGDKTAKVVGKNGDKSQRVLVLEDDADEDEPGRNEPWPASRKSDGKGKKVPGVKAAAEMSVKVEDPDANSSGTKLGSESNGKQVREVQQRPLAGLNGYVPLRSQFGINSKKKVASEVSSDEHAHGVAGNADENTPFTWITCTKCKKARNVPAEARLNKLSWCCERNTWDLEYPSHSAPQQHNDEAKVEELLVDMAGTSSKREIRAERLEMTDRVAKDKAQLNMVWVKLQVDGEELWWPGLLVTQVPPAIQMKLDESVEAKKKAVQLFHPRKDLEAYQVVKRSLLKPFHNCFVRFKDSNPHPDFKLAVYEAQSYFIQSDITPKNASSEHKTGTSERADLTQDAGGYVEDVAHEEAESNELELEDVGIPEADPQYSQPQADVDMEMFEDCEVIQLPAGRRKSEDAPESVDSFVVNDKRDEISTPALAETGVAGERGSEDLSEHVDEVGLSDKRYDASIYAKVETRGSGQKFFKDAFDAGGGIGRSDKREEVFSPLEAAPGVSEERKFKGASELVDEYGRSDKGDEVSSHSKAEIGGSEPFQLKTGLSEVNDASDKTKVSEASAYEEFSGAAEKFVLNLKITPKNTLIAYDSSSKSLHFQDGKVVQVDAELLGREFNKNSAGLSLHDCIRRLGKETIRRRFPKDAKSSNGLKFDALEQSSNFAARLRSTWLREYNGDPMPDHLKTRFVAGCMMEESGELVNWADDLTRTIRFEAREISLKRRDNFSSAVLQRIIRLLEKLIDKGSNTAALTMSEGATGEEMVDLKEYDRFCQQCTYGGELLCCDGRDCRRTYHLKCLDPPLEEVPTTSFFCPSCSAEASKSTSVEARQEQQILADSTILLENVGNLGGPSSVDHSIALEVDRRSKDTVDELPNTNLDAAISLSKIDADSSAQVGEELTTRGLPTEAVDCVRPQQSLPSKETQLVQAQAGLERETDLAVMSRLSTTKALYSETLTAYYQGPGKNACAVGAVSSTPRTPAKGSGATFSAIQFLNRDERNGCRAETSLLCASANSDTPNQQKIDFESDLEEGEIAPCKQAEAFDLNNAANKLLGSSTSQVPEDLPPVFELAYEQGESPSSDDHNSFCEGCEVGGELMLCDGKGCKVVYHKECLHPPLQDVPAGEWYCPQCESKRKGNVVEKIWAVREVGSGVIAHKTSTQGGRVESRSSDASSPENFQDDQCGVDDEASGAIEDLPLGVRFKSLPQCRKGQEGDTEVGRVAGGRATIRSTDMKDKGPEYLVQWKSRSHAHDKWVSEKELEKIAPKELARFKKLSPPSQGKYDSEWAEPERVIQKRFTKVPGRQSDARSGKVKECRAPNAELEWFVKWKGLGYEDCTWEPAHTGVLATLRGTELIDTYEGWADAAKQRVRRESQEEAERLSKVQIKDLECQPKWMIRQDLLPMQLDALNQLRTWWHARKNGILVYEASQEKIVMTIMFFLSLVEDFRVVHPILVVVPKSLIQIWEHELHLWAPKLNIVNYASKMEEAREIIRRTEFSSFCEPFKPHLVLTTFEVINCDMDHLKKLEWEVLIIDEGRRQRLQKSYQKSYRPFNQIRSIFRLLLLSEPLKSNVEELSQFVGFLEPRKSLVVHGDESTQVVELQRRLTGRVREYMPLNRLTEYWVPVEMTSVHLNQYYEILVEHYPTLSRNRKDQQIQEVVTKLRQSCNHPFLADPLLERTMGKGLTPKELLDHHIEISGKMRLVHLMMPILKSGGWRVLIFSQEPRQLDILERYMTQSHGSDSYERVDSDTAVKSKEAAIQRFNAEGSRRFVLLLKTGIHISFRNVQLVLIYDGDWNPANDMRALHKIHNEGEAGSKPLPVLRLYTQLTVEESTLVLFRDKQLSHIRGAVSAKICQKLLTWGASKIFELHDRGMRTAFYSQRPKGAKICSKAKIKQVVYDAEKVNKLLEAALVQEEGGKLDGDELIETILVPRDEPAPLYAEGDQPIAMVAGDSAEEFWASSLKWRHQEWQAKEVNLLGKGHRGRKRVTYDEDVMASAVYTKAQMTDENERKRPRRRKTNSEEDQDVNPNSPISGCPPAAVLESAKVSTDRNYNGSTPSADPEATYDARGSVLQSITPAMLPTPVIPVSLGAGFEGATEETSSGGAIQQKPSTYSEYTMEVLSIICSKLYLPEPVQERGLNLFKHVMHTSKNLRKPRELHEIIAIELATIWVAADQLGHLVDKAKSVSKVEATFDVHYDNRPQLEGPLYSKVRELCTTYRERPPTAGIHHVLTQSAAVSEVVGFESSARDHTLRVAAQPSARNAGVQATGGEELADIASQNPLASSQETGLHVEPVIPSSVATTSASPLAQVSLPTDSVPVVDAAQVAQAEPDIIFVEADPRLVSERPSDTFLTQSRGPTFQPPGTMTSSTSTLEQGLGWVIQRTTFPGLGGEEQEIVVDVVPPVIDSFPSKQVLEASRTGEVEDLHPHEDHLQSGEGDAVSSNPDAETSRSNHLRSGEGDMVSANLDARTSDLPAGSLTHKSVESPSLLLNENQVVQTEDVQPSRPNEPTVADTRARLAARLREDRAFVIHGQIKEIERSTSLLDRQTKELKEQFDKACLQLRGSNSVPGPLLDSQKELFDIDLRALTRRAQEDCKAMNARQRSDRDKLTECYNQLTTLSEISDGIKSDVSGIELEIQNLKNFYLKFMAPPLIQTPLQGSLSGQRLDERSNARSSSTDTSIAEALPPVTAQADDRSYVSPAMTSSRQTQGPQTEHTAQVPPSTSSVVTSAPQQQRGNLVHPLAGQMRSQVSDAQRSAAVSVAAMQPTSVQPPGQPQRRNSAVLSGSLSSPQREAAVVCRGPSMPAVIPNATPGVGPVPRPPVPALVGPQAGNVGGSGQVYPDVLLKEKEKLYKQMDNAKITYDSEAARIKAEYDKEAELLHRKYETLLVQEHRAFTKKQQHIQETITKVEWNRQLADALNLREELATRAAILAGAASANVQPLHNQQVPQQISVRPMAAGAAVASMHGNPARGITYTGSSGIVGASMQSPGTPSTRPSAPPLNQPPRYGMPTTRHNEQARSLTSRVSAVLSETSSRNTGHNVAGTTRVQAPNVSTSSPDLTTDATRSPRPHTSGTLIGVAAPMSSTTFHDPILNIIRNSVPTMGAVSEVISHPRETSSTILTAAAPAGSEQAVSDLPPRLNLGANFNAIQAITEAVTVETGVLAPPVRAVTIVLSDSDEEN